MDRLPYWRSAWLAAALFLLTLGLCAHAQTAVSGWGKLRTVNDTRSLDYSATPSLLGKVTPVTVHFYCNPKSDKQGRGVLGFDIAIKGVAALKPFHFDDFEGPDALANGKKLVQAVLVRAGQAQSFSLTQSGSYGDAAVFNFSVSAESRLPKSMHRSILEAAATDADSLQIVISDPRNTKVQLDLRIPVAERRADFKALLAGLR